MQNSIQKQFQFSLDVNYFFNFLRAANFKKKSFMECRVQQCFTVVIFIMGVIFSSVLFSCLCLACRSDATGSFQLEFQILICVFKHTLQLIKNHKAKWRRVRCSSFLFQFWQLNLCSLVTYVCQPFWCINKLGNVFMLYVKLEENNTGNIYIYP